MKTTINVETENEDENEFSTLRYAVPGIYILPGIDNQHEHKQEKQNGRHHYTKYVILLVTGAAAGGSGR